MRSRHTCGPATWLHLAATPAFAVMALVTTTIPATGMDMLCSPMRGTAALGSMAVMYLLMATFHAGPWLQMFLGRRWRRGLLAKSGRRGSRKSELRRWDVGESIGTAVGPDQAPQRDV